MSGRVLVTEAPRGSTSLVALPAARNDLSVITLTIPAASKTRGGAASTILTALGARDMVHGRVRHELNNIALASLWLTAHRTSTVIVCGLTDQASYRHLDTIAQITTAAAGDLFVVTDHGDVQRAYEAITPWCPRLLPWHEMPYLEPEPKDEEVSSDTWHADGAFAATDVFTYLASARRLLPASVFQAHYDLYVDALQRTIAWVALHGTTGLSRSAVTEAIALLVDEQHHWDDVVTVINGATAGFLRCGWLLTVEFDALRASLKRHAHSTWTKRDWLKIRAYRDPERAAIISLYMLGHSPQDIRSVTVADTAAWDTDPQSPLSGRVIPDVAAPYLRAQLLSRLSDGTTDADPLIDVQPRRICQDINHARATLDLNLGDFPCSTTAPLDRRRVTEDFIRIEDIS